MVNYPPVQVDNRGGWMGDRNSMELWEQLENLAAIRKVLEATLFL